MILHIYFIQRHIFIELDGNLWLLDTGSSNSFGNIRNLFLGGIQFQLPLNLPAPIAPFNAEMISKHIGVNCIGLIGMDILGRFDHIIDIGNNQLTISTNELEYAGQEVQLSRFGNFTILNALIANHEYRMLFDTGAQISFFLDNAVVNFPYAGRFIDFNPFHGEFETDIYQVEVNLNGVVFQLICGSRMPEQLSAGLRIFGGSGVIGNEMLINRVVGFAPRRNLMYI
ncbi:MAG: hypothetical protein BWY36_00646 [Candidatus Diapherotrites archaeon ADurb.Bin253]|nr:MAG: hypothetical protein BWY36_00646 [Candidatus Diapherotrites archaeon ADurb.Bin253]